MNARRRRICVVTGSRAEYGLLYWLLQQLRQDAAADLQLVVTGMHLAPEFGCTHQLIEADGFDIAARVSMLLSDDSPVGIAKSTGLGVIGFADAFANLRPDLVVVLGDRFETFAAAQAALFARIPIAHLHGGESTEGAIDESLRHAITKMAHLHLVAAEPYRARVVQMGEAPEHVFNVGAPGLDWIQHTQWLELDDLRTALNMPLRRPLFLMTYHPATLDRHDPAESLAQVLGALDHFTEASIVITYPNADAGGRRLIDMIGRYAKAHAPRVGVFVSLGQQVYLSLMRACDLVLGNSSSGLTEAPALRKPTVNIGDRQAGRLRASSVIDCAEETGAVIAAIRQALSDPFQQRLAGTVSPYGEGGASRRIADILTTVDLGTLTKKRFHALPALAPPS